MGWIVKQINNNRLGSTLDWVRCLRREVAAFISTQRGRFSEAMAAGAKMPLPGFFGGGGEQREKQKRPPRSAAATRSGALALLASRAEARRLHPTRAGSVVSST